MIGKPLVVLASLFVAMSTSGQERPPGFHNLLRTGDVAGLTAAIEKYPSIANLPDAQGVPPMFWAAFYGQKAVVELLLSRGADPRSSCQFGTSVHGAVHGGRPDIVGVLAARGCDLNAADPAGRPPLIIAAQTGRLPVLEALLDAGASVTATDRTGNTALLMAASYGHESVVRALLSRKASLSQVNVRGDTPLDAARRQRHSSVAAYLERQGAVPRRSVTAPAGPFLGQTLPGRTAKLFAPAIVSTERRELNLAFFPDGRAAFFSRDRGPRGTLIMMTTSDDRGWTMPVPAPFSEGGHSDVDVFVTADGREIYFCSDRPVPGVSPLPAASDAAPSRGTPPPPPPGQRSAIWMVTRTVAGWDEPTWLGPVINAGPEDYYPTLTRSGTLYFSSNRPGGLGENDIYRARRVDGRWTPPENLGQPISSQYREFDPFIAPDESYLIFASTRPGGLGNADLYISFRDSSGKWSEPKNMGPAVNSPDSDYTPMLSPDGKYLFFTSSREGQDDLFWIDAGVIASLRPTTPSRADTAHAAGLRAPLDADEDILRVPVRARLVARRGLAQIDRLKLVQRYEP